MVTSISPGFHQIHGVQLSWVGARRVPLRPVSSRPPLSTGRAPFKASGSAPPIHAPSKVLAAFLPLAFAPRDASCPACASAKSLWASLFGGSGPSPSGLLLVCTAVPCADASAPSDSPSRPQRFVGLSRAACPPSCASCRRSPVCPREDAHAMLSVAGARCPVRAVRLPSGRTGEGRLTCEVCHVHHV